MVLQGKDRDPPSIRPYIIPELQNRSVISVVVGQDHYGALTSSGKLLTWGKYSRGALGLEDPGNVESLRGYTEGERVDNPPRVTVPAEARSDHHQRSKGERRIIFPRISSRLGRFPSRGRTTGEQAYDPPKVTVPTEVRFDHHERMKGEGRVERYCFAVAALWYRTAALVFDLAGDEVPPDGSNQNALHSVRSSLVCNDP